MRRLFANVVLRLMRYTIVGEPPKAKAYVMVAAPHTSNWDFPLMIAIAWSNGISPVWLGKKEMFKGPLGPIFRALGGIKVDRENASGVASTLAQRAKSEKTIAIVVEPEGTRGKTEYWKSGFRRIAIEAGVPLVLAFVDGPTRTGGFGPEFFPSEDVGADMDRVREFYADKHGYTPGNFTTPRLREEDTPNAP